LAGLAGFSLLRLFIGKRVTGITGQRANPGLRLGCFVFETLTLEHIKINQNLLDIADRFVTPAKAVFGLFIVFFVSQQR
jgi:hypothetical protein